MPVLSLASLFPCALLLSWPDVNASRHTHAVQERQFTAEAKGLCKDSCPLKFAFLDSSRLAPSLGSERTMQGAGGTDPHTRTGATLSRRELLARAGGWGGCPQAPGSEPWGDWYDRGDATKRKCGDDGWSLSRRLHGAEQAT
ncbi:hypothetical protein DMC30DRAFT_388969 [Rhodotorula diobovata]|uniref:Uncharacterized protein n=1 Tax=Rhodotorula diobovata TaxID=5288 RepID=A0A5C5G3A1_9BASI|nr:hypothetical protein DMC30DRAFT_388969 [Rhodotorula diobovata]